MSDLPATLNALTRAVRTAYGMVRDPDGFVRGHIAELRASHDPLAARSGEVLEKARVGFGLGALAPLAIIATGQFMLGHPLAAIGTLAAGPTLAQPLVLTTAALAALYAGWRALSKDEQAMLVERIGRVLTLGAELLRALIAFVVEKVREVFSAAEQRGLRRLAAAVGKPAARSALKPAAPARKAASRKAPAQKASARKAPARKAPAKAAPRRAR